MATKLTIRRVVRRFREPLVTSFGTLAERITFEVELEGEDGMIGRGEAAPLEPYDGVSLDAVEFALGRYAAALGPLNDGPEILSACQDTVDLPQALAAIDLALWDRAGKREGHPVSALLADHALSAVPVNATIGAVPPEAAEAAAARAIRTGFTCVKVKVGIDGDAERLAAVRAGGGAKMAIRIDANGAWDALDAAKILPALDQAAGGLELIEEPVSGASSFRELAQLVPSYRIAADETGIGAAPITCLKVSRSGGISALCAHAAFAEAQGGEIYLASTFDGPIGIAAAVHCAAALGVELPCGLATLGALECEPAESLIVADGSISVPTGPGLGV